MPHTTRPQQVTPLSLKIALGVFDAVHRGHQKVIEHAHLALAITPHPRPELGLLTSPEEKKGLISNLAEFRFSARHARMAPEEFIIWLKRKYAPAMLIAGHDFHFGHQRQGNIATLRRLANKYQIAVSEIPEYTYRGEIVRSSAIRRYLRAGQLDLANALLGREYQLNGRVISGQRLGRRLGFPTINLRLDHPQKLVPRDGVYAGEAIAQNKLHPAAIFIGRGNIEAHLINFQGSLYGQPATLLLQHYLRPNKEFTSLQALSKQIRRDVRQIKARLNHAGL